MQNREASYAFTLIELLVVVGVIAIISIVVVLVLNPSQLLMQSRDATRLSDMASLNNALGIYAAQGGSSLGNANTVYVSIPDPSATSSLGDQCQGLNLPALPTSDTYQCMSSTTFRSVNSQGWIPASFSNISGGSPLGALPVDPLNTTSSGNYYTYATNGSQYVVTAIPESQKYRAQYAVIPSIPDYPGVIAQGSSFTLSPLYSQSGLAGYWQMDEGSGSSTSDASGNETAGSWNGTASGTSGYYSSGKVGSWAGMFNGVNNTVNMGTAPAALQVPSSGLGSLTASVWIKTAAAGTAFFIDFKSAGSNNPGYDLFTTSNGEADVRIADGVSQKSIATSAGLVNDNNWHNVVGVIDSSAALLRIYVDGTQKGTVSYSTSSILTSGDKFTLGGYNGTTADYPGLIDDARIYSRALSPAEILALYNAQK